MGLFSGVTSAVKKSAPSIFANPILAQGKAFYDKNLNSGNVNMPGVDQGAYQRNIYTPDYSITFDQGGARLNETGLAKILRGQMETEYGQLGQPQQRIENLEMEHALRTLEPQWQATSDEFQRNMAQRGLPVGSQAYSTGMNNLLNAKNQALQEAAYGAIRSGREAQGNIRQNIATALAGRENLMSPLQTMSGFTTDTGAVAANQQAIQNAVMKKQAKEGRLAGILGAGSQLLAGGLF